MAFGFIQLVVNLVSASHTGHSSRSPSILAHSAAAIRFSRMWNARCERASNAESSHPHSELLIVVVILRTSVILNQADKYMIYDTSFSVAHSHAML